MLLFGTGCKRPCLSRMSRRGNIISRRAPWRVRTICVSKSKNGGVVGGGSDDVDIFYFIWLLPGTWGLNDKGQLGLGDTEAREYPTQVLLPRSIK